MATPTPIPLRGFWMSLNPFGVTTARDADVSFLDNHISVTATTSSFFDSTISQKGAILLDIDLIFIVAILTLLIGLGDGPGFRLISLSDTTTFEFDCEIGDNLRSVHIVKHGN